MLFRKTKLWMEKNEWSWKENRNDTIKSLYWMLSLKINYFLIETHDIMKWKDLPYACDVESLQYGEPQDMNGSAFHCKKELRASQNLGCPNRR